MNDKLDNLHNFLRGNVVSPSTSKVITLFDFEFDWEEFKGSFSLKLDSDVMKERFDFRVEIDGKYEISPPFHISPMGVPGSYPKIELTEETTYRINKLINDFFPNLKPLGLDKSTGLMIDRNTSMNDRVVDVGEVISKMKEVWVGGFQLCN
ncbi:hypothetical protein [Polynucleobacter sp. JS-JIR-5-A7]|uniref:hypothetical protein n=1 Tax=Polynucleobacter sp. JS-JIR-5-A7 TaxID=1758395 RepID=UPI001BFD5292|nr:hypothetical protein [Polynucleobacter sp. JS-JIR-5-A7]QWE06396.1 hypothetical protein AOC29_09865 [Polynucleobacter sp. JS-JIR-5-A7]